MRKYLQAFFNRFEVGEKTSKSILAAFDQIGEAEFQKLDKIYADCAEGWFETLKSAVECLAKYSSVHVYTVNFLAVVCLFPRLEARHAARGIDKTVTNLTLCDLIYKLHECQTVFGVDGIMAFEWYQRILEERTFALGRLQFEIAEYRWEDEYVCPDGVLKKGDAVLSVHIPSSGEPMTKETCHAAYRAAYEFFTRYFPNLFSGKVAFACWSWLLYPKNREIMPDARNILRFLEDFTIIQEEEYANNDAVVWRIFGVDKTGNARDLPEETRLQKNVKKFLVGGGMLGWGYGVFHLDKAE